MKMFRMMLLPLIVGALFLFCSAPGAKAATDCDWDLALNNHSVTAANLMDVKFQLAAETNLGLFFFDLPEAFKFDAGQSVMTNGVEDRVWNMTFMGLPAGTIRVSESVIPDVTTVSTGGLAATSLTTAATAECDVAVNPTTVPEAPSVLYLGSGLVLCGGFWMRRRRF
jgi:hypothetical protein